MKVEQTTVDFAIGGRAVKALACLNDPEMIHRLVIKMYFYGAHAEDEDFKSTTDVEKQLWEYMKRDVIPLPD